MADIFGKLARMADIWQYGPQAVRDEDRRNEMLGLQKEQTNARLEAEKARKAYWESKLKPQIEQGIAGQSIENLLKFQAQLARSLGGIKPGSKEYEIVSGTLGLIGDAINKQSGKGRVTGEDFDRIDRSKLPKAQSPGNPQTAGMFAFGSVDRPVQAGPSGGALGAISPDFMGPPRTNFTPPGVQSKWLSMTPEERSAYYTGKPKPPDIAAQAMESKPAPGPTGDTGEEVQRITTAEEYYALPSGASYIGPDGLTRRKP